MSYPGVEFDEITRAAVFPPDYRNPTPKDRYHLVVIGGGTAGLITAIGAAGLGAKVALVECERMGGDCLNVGCVPSKALLEYSRVHPDHSFDAAFAYMRSVRAGIAPHDSVSRYSELGVDVFLGRGQFATDGSVHVGEAVLRARRVVIATGAKADVPPIPGLVDADPLTNDTVFDLVKRPASLAILGGGVIGCELAMVFARLGTEVHIFEGEARLLPLELPAAGAAVADAMRALGVAVHAGAFVQSVQPGAPHVVDNGSTRVAVESILVALGRRPNTNNLGLDQVGVSVDDRGFIVTDAKLRTNNKHIYAAGDCTAALQLTHHADAQARVAVQNALFAPTASTQGLIIPRVTYTRPEVASVGASASSLTTEGRAFDTYRVEFSELDRGRAEVDGSGFAELYTSKGKDEILGATIVGHDAGEQIAAVVLLMTNGLGLSAAGKSVFAYPTRAEFLKRMANEYNRTRLSPAIAKLFDLWLRVFN